MEVVTSTVAPTKMIGTEMFLRCFLWPCAHKMVPTSQPYQVRKPDEGGDISCASCLTPARFVELTNTGSGMA